jgi:hypothetical protein
MLTDAFRCRAVQRDLAPRRDEALKQGEDNMAGPQIPQDFRRVIIAASVGNVIEWYDFLFSEAWRVARSSAAPTM